MSLPKVHPLLADELLVVLSATFMENFTVDEQDIIGTFFSALGAIVSFNSTYLPYLAPPQEEKQENDDGLDLLKKSVDKLQEEMDKMQKEKH